MPLRSSGIAGNEFDSTLVPAAFCAATVQVYGVLLVSPLTTTGELADVAVTVPGLQVPRYAEIVAPPVLAGAAK